MRVIFAAFGINSILYQRGIYPAETFTRVTKYDMSLQLTTDPKLKNYLTNVVTQLKGCFFFSVLNKPKILHSCSSIFKMEIKVSVAFFHQTCYNIILAVVILFPFLLFFIFLLSHILHCCTWFTPAEWLFDCTVQKLVVVITCLETNEVLERWQFDIECDKTAKESRYSHEMDYLKARCLYPSTPPLPPYICVW